MYHLKSIIKNLYDSFFFEFFFTTHFNRYCKDPKTIILCVVPANADITTSDGLMMAR